MFSSLKIHIIKGSKLFRPMKRMRKKILFAHYAPNVLKLLLKCSCFFLFFNSLALANITPSPISTTTLKQLTAQFVQLKQGQLEYYQFGQGSPIVLIPGYVTDISSWHCKFLLTLAMHHQVIVFNNRNVGRSSFHSTHYESKDLAEDTYQLIAALHLKKPTIVGISMGGMIAQQLAVTHENKIGPLILMNTLIPGSKAILPNADIKKRLQNVPRNKLARYFSGINLFFPFSWRISMAYSLVVNRFQPKDYEEINLDKVLIAQQNLLTQWTKDEMTANKIKHLKLPVLILNGKLDAVIPPINSVILAKTISGAKLMSIEEGGHAMIYQFPEQIANAINRFLYDFQNAH